MKRFITLIFLVSLFSLALTPISASSKTPQVSQLPIPQGFCVQITVPVYAEGIIAHLTGNSVGLIPLHLDIFFSEELKGDVYQITGWMFTDQAQSVESYGMGFDEFAYLFIDALSGEFFAFGDGSISLLSRNACSFPAYRDNAALAQTYLVPDTGYDVYQIFDGAGILSFRVTQEALANASAGDVLGSNDAGNITFTYNGGGKCTVAYPYPDGKMGSKTFTCQGEITDWGRTPIEPNFFFLPI
ncbi:MAG: hypothetical protein SFZ02_13130 [bacterium]|nr:hypothetical protein [bacterium]